MGLYLSKDGVSKIWTKAKSTFQAKGNYVTTDTAQTISGVKTYNAPTNVNGSEQTTTKFKTSNGGAIIFGKEGPNSGTMIRLDQADGTCRLRFRSSDVAGAMVWEQPEQGAQLYIDLGKDGADKHRIQFPGSAGTLALKSELANYLPLSGGTLTGNLTGKYITGTWLQTTQANDLGKAPTKYGVIDASGWLYTRTLDETKKDLGINDKAPIGHSHESIIDYGDTTNTIKIGYRGNGLTASQIAYIAGYSVDDPNNPTEHKIKDISKDVLKSWLGYTEVSSGIISYGGTLTATSGYVWIVYPYDDTANTFKFTYGSGDRTGYGFAIVQGGGCIRYFQSTTQLTRYSISSITFSTMMVYIKFKIDG